MPTIETLTVDVRANTSALSSGLKTAGLAVGALAVAGGLAFKAWEESEAVGRETAATIEATGGAANVTADEVSALSAALSEKTAIDDEVIQSGQNMLLTFKNIRNEAGKGNDIFNQASTVLVDFAAKMGTEPKAAAVQLGKALNDPIKGISALSRAGVQFTGQQERQITKMQESGNLLGAQKIILAELEGQMKGTAEAQKTGSMEASVAFGELQEALGGVVAGGLTPLLEAAMPVIDFLAKSPGLTAALIVGITGLVVAYKLWQTWTLLTAAAQTTLLAAMPWVAIAVGLVALVVLIVKNWDKVKAVIMAVWGAIKAAGMAVFNVLKTIVMAYFNVYKAIFMALKAVTLAVWNAIKAVASAVWNGIVGVVQGAISRVRGIVQGVKSFILGVWQTIKQVGTSIWDGIRGAAETAFNGIVGFFTAILNDIIGGVNAVIRGINLVKPGSDIASIPTLARGGRVMSTGLAVVHEGEVFSGVGRAFPSSDRVQVGVRLDRRRFSDDLDYDTEYRGWA